MSIVNSQLSIQIPPFFELKTKAMNKRILNIALPSIVSNITVPLLGLVDVAIVGHLGSASYIGAIAVGGMLFNMIYWIFGFLRMGTSGLTSQALGKRDLAEVVWHLVRALAVGLGIALILVALQKPLMAIAFRFISATPEVADFAATYFHICVWGAPAVLGLYGFAGWYIGMQNSRFPMYIAIVQNVVNIAASLGFVFGLGMKVEGVALGTLIAQYSGLGMAIILWLMYYSRLREHFQWVGCFRSGAMKQFFALNRDIFFRTLCLVAVTVFFTSTGAAHGDVILAVNTLLMQLFTLFSYIMDGFAYAGEALSGLYVGAKNATSLRRMTRALFGWGIGLAALFTLLYGLGGEAFLGLLTDDVQVIEASRTYFYWALAIPASGFAAFLWDGIFIGATASRQMLYAMVLAALTFFGLYYGLRASLGNHALWLAFLSYLAVRGVAQTLMAGTVMAKARR